MNAPAGDENSYSRFKGWHQSEFGQFKSHWAAYYNKEIAMCLKQSRSETGQNLKILEIGYGNGSFMGWAKSEGHSVFGVEIESEQLDRARSNGFVVGCSVNEIAQMLDEKDFDGIVAFDVFEHLQYSELKDLLAQIDTVLKPGGWILARFPNGDSPFGRINQNGDLTHKIAIGTTAVEQIASLKGYSVLSITDKTYPIRGQSFVRILVQSFQHCVQVLFEAPIQILLNFYYLGRVRWYLLGPNLTARLMKSKLG